MNKETKMKPKFKIIVTQKDEKALELSYEQFSFSGGEQHVRLNKTDIQKIDWQQVVLIEVKARLQNSEAIMQLLLLRDALTHLNLSNAPVDLVVPYFPYARQDRVCVTGEAFSVNVMTGLLKAANFSRITVWDLHSNVSEALLNPNHVSQAQLVGQFSKLIEWLTENHATLVAPDKGASLKIKHVANALGFKGLDSQIIQAHKKRDPVTGNIIATEVNADVDGKNLLILDDICDGGRTFIELAKVLKQQGAEQIGLYVTHGIFSKGFEPFIGLIDHIFTTDSFIPTATLPQSNVISIDTLQLFDK